MSGSEVGGGEVGGAGGSPFATFRPVRARIVATIGALLILVVFTGGAIVLPGPSQDGGWSPVDRSLLVLFGLAVAGFLRRYATLKAIPTRTHLTVRNLMSTRRVTWQEVVGLSFSGGDPWVTLDLSDTDTLAVMAIQRADGDRAKAEASRLAALIEALGEGSENLTPDGGLNGPSSASDPT